MPVSARGAPGGLQTSILSMTRLVRGRINANNEWVDQQDIYCAARSLHGQRHPLWLAVHVRWQGSSFWTVGDRGDKANGQNLGSPLGKVHSVNDDGSVPKDNPFVNTSGAIPSI
jgi:glucose/arabinose dehydrogenase